MTGVPRSIAEHRLNIREGYSPVRQKKRGQAPERNKAIQEEVEKLVDAGIMKEVHYHSWLSNPVMVKKSRTESWGDGAAREKPTIIRDITEKFKTLRQIKNIKTRRGVLSFAYPRCNQGRAEVNGNISKFKQILVKISRKNPLPFFKNLKNCTKRAIFIGHQKPKEAFKANEKSFITELQSLLLQGKQLRELIIPWLQQIEAIQRGLKTEREGSAITSNYICSATSTEAGIQIYWKKCWKWKEESSDELMAEPEVLPEPWTLFTDGSSCVDGSGAGAREELKEKSIHEKEILDIVEEEGNTWMTPIREYLTKEILLEDKKKARAVRRKAVRFGLPGEIISDNGKRSADNPFGKIGVKKKCGMPMLLLPGLKGDWIEELPLVLWLPYNDQVKQRGNHLFSLTSARCCHPAVNRHASLRTQR
ncbi:hypothetical protein Tco_0740796 [Tanacetum coccineum]